MKISKGSIYEFEVLKNGVKSIAIKQNDDEVHISLEDLREFIKFLQGVENED